MIRRVLHTSDWHIGRKLKDKDRTYEFTKFFLWLDNLIKEQNIDVLLVAGDVFDNTTPSTTAQNIYYSFLAECSCRHVVIISGNHDSPAFIDAPAKLLERSNIHVVGQACEHEIITLNDNAGNPELVVCAVPYLRDRDVRTLSAEGAQNIEQELCTGIAEHYARVFEEAGKFSGVPVIAMGHLFVKGGTTRNDDGTRQLYVGTAVQVGSDIFPEFLTYTALGHLHSPQSVGRKNIRYSGAPLAMGFGEAGQKKSVCILELDGGNLTGISEVSIPEFQRLGQVKGDMQKIADSMKNFAAENVSVWLDVTYNGREIITDLQERLNEHVKDYPLLEIISVHDESIQEKMNIHKIPEGLESIRPLQMLELFFAANSIPEEQQKIFTPMYKEIVSDLGANN